MAGLRQLGNTREYLQEFECFEGGDGSAEGEVSEVGNSASTAGLAALEKTIETEIVPRLMLAHKAEMMPKEQPAPGAALPDPHDVADFTAFMVDGDMQRALDQIEGLRSRGVSLEAIYLELMAPAARDLGEQWIEDRSDFITVTLALSRMQQLLHALSPDHSDGSTAFADGRKALLVTVPGEQHTFGIYMVAELFRQKGWDVWGGVPESQESVIEFVKGDWFDVIGVSVSSQSSVVGLGKFIRRIRKCSCNKDIGVLLGGRAFEGKAELAADLSAHAVIADGRRAVAQAQQFVGRANRLLA